MVQSDIQPRAFIRAYLPDTPNWAEGVLAYLKSQGYYVIRMEQPDLSGYRQHAELQDILLTIYPPDCSKFRRHFKQNSSVAPILVLITEKIPDDADQIGADLILPPLAEHIEYQLKKFLQMRQEHSALQEYKETLETEALHLRDDLLTQKRLGDKAELLKNAIVRNVSHELKTPLLQVKAAVHLLAEDVKNEELISYAQNATARLETIVKNIAMLGSSLDVNLNPVIVRDAIEAARRNIGRIWEHRNNDTEERLKVIIEEHLPPVMADKQGLNTVLQLLIDNALKFSDDVVEVHVRKVQQQVHIAVKDKGIGIAKNELEAIFESFYQVDSSSTRRYGGTGVGLAIVRLILENHNTSITVESKEGRGSTFSFKLPLVEV